MKPGVKVICINDHHQDKGTPCVVKGEIYTIRGISPATGGLYLAGITLDFIRPGLERAFLRSRFREIDEQFGEKVLEKILEEMKTEVQEIVQ